MRTHLQLGTLVLTSLLGFTATTAKAQLLAYEGWDYTANATFTGLSGGSGWSAPWALNGGNTLNSITVAGSFSYTDNFGYSLVTSGNRAHVTGDGSATGDNLPGGTSAGAQPLRTLSFDRGIDGSTTSTWVSFLAIRTGLANPTPGTAPNDYLYGRAFGVQFFNNATTTATGAGNEQFSIGRATQSSETDTSLANDTWSISNQGGANNQKVSNLSFVGTADFILMRIDHVGSTVNDAANADTIRIWINPPDLNNAPSDASATLLNRSDDFLANGVNRDFFFNRIRLFGGNAQTTPSGRSYGSEEVDELRIGLTYADVTPNVIPEPASLALVGMGLLALAVRRRF